MSRARWLPVLVAAFALGNLQAGERADFRVSLVVQDGCTIHNVRQDSPDSTPRVDCSADQPYRIAAPSVARATAPDPHPGAAVDEGDAAADARVRTVVF